MKPRVLITDSDLGPPLIEREVCEKAGFELLEAECHSEEEVVRAVREATPVALLVQYAPVTPAAIAAGPDLRAVARYGVGLDTIDVAECERSGIAVLNVPDYAVDEVADHSLMLALALVRQAPAWTAATRSGEWPSPDPSRRPPRTLDAMTVGLAGFGRIARAVARRVASFGADLIVHDPFLPPERIESGGATPVEWEELWARADLVSLHMPLGPTTEGSVDRAALGAMRPGSYLVNTARAGLLDRGALEEALDSGQLGGVALDVWWQEPPHSGDDLFQDPRVVATPHIAYLSDRALPRLRRLAAEGLVASLRETDGQAT